MDGRDFLDPIPEDVSVVAASQHAVNLPTVSAVASSDSRRMTVPRDNTANKIRRGKRGRKWEGRETDPARILESTGGAAAVEDNVSDVNASLGGANDHDLEVPFPASPSTERSKVEYTSKSFSLSPNCRKWSLIFLGIVSIVGVGIYIIVVRLPEEKGNDNAFVLTDGLRKVSSSPTPSPKFLSFEISYSSTAPSASPAYNPAEVKVFDNAILKLSGTTNENIFDMNTPEGKGRDWMINSDVAINVDEEQRVQQRYILCVLYLGTNGDFWKEKCNWLNAERSECDWFGITCNNENNIIERIDLSENNVTGTLPNEISSLSNLVALNMSYNNISGTIPEKIFDLLDELEMLDMQENQIIGTIPEKATSTSKSVLRFLDLGSNQLTGSLPFFPDVESISFDKNNLTSIDVRYSTSSPSLKEFGGFHNRLSGPLPTIWNLPDLIELDLGYNFWTGTIPQDLLNLPSLKSLMLDHCNLTGPLPSYSESATMHRLWLHSNLLSGTIPLGFGWNWTKLYSVKLQGNLLTGSITQDQCNRWEGSYSGDDSTEVYLSSSPNKNNDNDSSRGRPKPWTFDTDCQINCVCCTNTNCASTTSINVDGRR